MPSTGKLHQQKTMATDPIQDLRQFLVECPRKHNNRFDNNTRKDIRKALFKAASLNGKYLKLFFPSLGNSDVKGKVSSMEQSAFEWIINTKKHYDPSHPGRPCVRKFRVGEPTYRCL